MPQRDFILRMIEQLGAMLVALRKMILGGGDPRQIEDALASAAQETGLELAILRGLTLDSLLSLVSPSGEVEPTRCWIMAEVLGLDGLQAAREGRATDARSSLLKARALFDLMRPRGVLVGFPEADERIAGIDQELEALSANGQNPGEPSGDSA